MSTEHIVLWDAQGRKVLVTRQEWVTRVLPANLRDAWSDASALARLIVDSLR